MATRSTIWLKDEETNSYKGIYCHFDGSIANNGKILVENYSDIDRVKELINLGSISSLQKNILPKGDSHSFDNREKDVVVAYHRDRGEDLMIYEEKSLDDVYEKTEEYNYIFENNEWMLLDLDDLELHKVKELLLDLEDNDLSR